MAKITCEECDTLTLSKAFEKIDKHEGIVIWWMKEDAKIAFLKVGKWNCEDKSNVITHGWITMRINKNRDNTFKQKYIPEIVKKLIEENIQKGDEFHWFENEKECIEFLYKKRHDLW